MKHQKFLDKFNRFVSPNDAVPVLLEQALLNHGWDAPRSARTLVELQLQDIEVRERVSGLVTRLESVIKRATDSGFHKKGERIDEHWLSEMAEDLRFSLQPERGIELALREHVELLERKLQTWDDFSDRLLRHEAGLASKGVVRASSAARKVIAKDRKEVVRQYLSRLSPGPYDSLRTMADVEPYQALVPYGGKEYVSQSGVESRYALGQAAAVNHAYRLEQLSNRAVRRMLPAAEAEAQIKKWWNERYQRYCSSEDGRSRFRRLRKIQERLGLTLERITPIEDSKVDRESRTAPSGRNVARQHEPSGPMEPRNRARWKEYQRVVDESRSLREPERARLQVGVAQAEDMLRKIDQELLNLEGSQAKYTRETVELRRYMGTNSAGANEEFYRACIGRVEEAQDALERYGSELSSGRGREVRKRLESLNQSLRRTELPPDGWEDLGLKNTMFVRPVGRWVSHADYAELPFPEPKLYMPRFDEDLDTIQSVCDRVSALAEHLTLFSHFDAIAKAGDPRLWPRAGREVEIAGRELTVRALTDGGYALRWEIRSVEADDLKEYQGEEAGKKLGTEIDWPIRVDLDAPGVVEIAIGDVALARFGRFDDFTTQVRDFYLRHREAACADPLQHEFFLGIQRLGQIRRLENLTICPASDNSVVMHNWELSEGAVLRQLIASGSGVVLRLRGGDVMLNDITLEGVSLDVSVGTAHWQNCVSDAATVVRGSLGRSAFDADSALSWDMTEADMRGIQAVDAQASFNKSRFCLSMLSPDLARKISGEKLSAEELAESARARNQAIGRKRLGAIVSELFPKSKLRKASHSPSFGTDPVGASSRHSAEVVFDRDTARPFQRFSLKIGSTKEANSCQLAQQGIRLAGSSEGAEALGGPSDDHCSDRISFQRALFHLLDIRYEGIFHLESAIPASAVQAQGFMADVPVRTKSEIWVARGYRV